MSGNRTTHLRFFRPTRTDRLRYHPIIVGITGLEPATPWSQTKYSKPTELHPELSSHGWNRTNEPFVYQTNALNQLSYVRMLARLPRFELGTTVLETVMIPFHHRRVFSNMSKNQKKTLNFFVVQGFLIYLMIRLHLIKNPELTAILPLNRKP